MRRAAHLDPAAAACRMDRLARLLLCLLLGASLLLQGLAIASARPPAHFHIGTPAPLALLDTGHADSSAPRDPGHRHGVLSDHAHAIGSAGVVTVDAADDGAGGISKLPLHGLDAPAPGRVPWLPAAARFSHAAVPAAAFRSRVEAPPAPPPKRPA
jgi:hypothetical protein